MQWHNLARGFTESRQRWVGEGGHFCIHFIHHNPKIRVPTFFYHYLRKMCILNFFNRFCGIMPLFLIVIIFNNHSHSTILHSFILHHSPRPVFLCPHRFFAQQEKNLRGVPHRAEIRTRACLTGSRRQAAFSIF